MDRETEEYLAKIRKTIAESKQMVESAKLRFSETDRMLEESGTSREEIMKMRFTPEQKKAVNAANGYYIAIFDQREKKFSLKESVKSACIKLKSCSCLKHLLNNFIFISIGMGNNHVDT